MPDPSNFASLFQPQQPNPIPKPVEFFPIGFFVERGEVILPASGLAGLILDLDGELATFIPPENDTFRAHFFFAIEGIESDPSAVWNFTFTWKDLNLDEFEFFVRQVSDDLDPTLDNFIGDTENPTVKKIFFPLTNLFLGFRTFTICHQRRTFWYKSDQCRLRPTFESRQICSHKWSVPK